MADQNISKKTEEALMGIAEKLHSTGALSNRCRECGDDRFTLLAQAALVPLSAPVADHPGIGPSLPCVAVICDNCKNMRFFGAGRES